MSSYLSPVNFPPEIWNHIFGYLSVTDKCSVRAASKHFKKLIDHCSLWKDWTVVLSFENGAYHRKFWETLRRRKVFSVVMRSTKAKHWGLLSQSLPAVTTVVLEASLSQPKSFSLTGDFPHLTRLALRNVSLLFDMNMGCKLQNLTHLSICGVTTKPQSDFLLLLPHLRRLTSLVCHKTNVFGKRVRMVDIFVAQLPQLKNLSLSVDYIHPQVHGPGIETVSSLSSLELVDCMVHLLPEDILKLIPSLKSLGVFYQESNWGLPKVAKEAEHLNNLLHKFTNLTKLVIFRGGPLNLYVTSIPASVTSLTLCLLGLSSEDLAVLAVQVPNLLHLHIDLWPAHLGARTALIPELFPKLRSLRLRQEHVPEKDFLCLHKLQDLQCLEVLDWSQNLSHLTDKFRAITQHRVQIVTSRQRDALICSCVSQVY